MTRFTLTPSQTVGPFFHPGMLRDGIPAHQIARPDTPGQHIRVEGMVFDGAGDPVPDAMIEIWQANSQGRYHHPADQRGRALDAGFIGFGRVGTDADGRYGYTTVKPGPVPFDTDTFQAPHICLTIFARGLLQHLLTRMYFDDEPATEHDPVLSLVPPERRVTLLAIRAAEDSDGRATYQFDIVLQGDGETVFLNPT